MSSLTDSEKHYLKKLLDMDHGYVLDYTDATYAEVFRRHKIDIHGEKYQTWGTSKAKKMQAFWEQEPDAVVSQVLSEMLDSYKANCDLNGHTIDIGLLDKCQEIVKRLSGKTSARIAETISSFLDKEFVISNINELPIEGQIISIIESRLTEMKKALDVGAHLSVIFLCGSVLEGVLLGVAQKNPEQFNRSPTSPKDAQGKAKPLHEWSLAHFIDTAYDIKLLGLDVKKFSHELREFRNYIHPYEQMKSKFKPDEHTAKVCFQVLKAALANLIGDR
ncbi:MAG: hypothetical protein GKR77_03805 [Legionellales bacterium]|nr:hypothetical protein [Legionellales bacterium]